MIIDLQIALPCCDYDTFQKKKKPKGNFVAGTFPVREIEFFRIIQWVTIVSVFYYFIERFELLAVKFCCM